MNPDLFEGGARLWDAGLRAVWQQYTAAGESLREQGRALAGQTPASVIYAEGRARVLHYHPLVEPPHPVPLLCIPSMINRYYVMDLTPERSLVRFLLRQGIDVYMLDWGTATPVDRYRTLDEAIAGMLRRVVGAIRRASGQPAVSLLGYCMGGMMAAVYSALFPQDVAALVNLAGPINYHDDGIYSVWTRPEWFDADRLVDTLGNIPANVLNTTFHLVRPTDQLIQALNYWERRDDPAFLRTFAALHLWLNDPTPFPGEIFRKYVKALYQQNQLILGQFRIGERRIDLATVAAPALTIAARRDHIAPWGSVAVLHDLIASQDKELIVLESGHIGMVVGSDAHAKLWPRLAGWLAARSGGDSSSPPT